MNGMQMGNGYRDEANEIWSDSEIKGQLWKDHELKKWNKDFEKWKNENEKSPRFINAIPPGTPSVPMAVVPNTILMPLSD